MNERPTHLDLFSGIGGFSLAFESAGFETIGFSEVDPYACAVLKKHWPNVVNYGDVRTVPTESLVGRVDVITGGFPCQPFSVAGKRRGKSDDRHLWPAMLRVIDAIRPAWVCGENVPGIVGMVLADILSDLEKTGYQCATFIVPACAVGAPHIRDRIWIIANATTPQLQEAWRGSPRQRRATLGPGERSGDLADAMRSEGERLRAVRLQPEPAGNGEVISDASGAGREEFDAPCLAARQAHSARRLVAGGLHWSTDAGIRRVADGIPNRVHRIKCGGNSIVPQVAEIFARAIYQEITK